MKILYFAEYYEAYINHIYARNSALKDLGYNEQLRFLIDDYFGSFGSYVNNVNALGNNGFLIIANAYYLQKAWALENNIVFDEKNWKYSISIQQIKSISPDVFFIGSMFNYFGSYLAEVKKYCKKVYCWIGCPIPHNLDMTNISLVLTSLPTHLDFFRKNNLNAEILNAAFDSEIFKKINKKDTVDFSFIGGYVSSMHVKRMKSLKVLCKKSNLKVWGYGFNELIDNRPNLIRHFFPNPILKNYMGELWGMDMYNKLANSKITFNSHGDVAGEYAVNMRMYEATGCGTLLLTDGKYSKLKLFEDRKEVVFYDSIEEAIELVDYYLKHENERVSIANAGQKVTFEKYNYRKTTELMISYFNKYLN